MLHCCCTLTDVLFSVFVQCVVAALSSFLLPLNTAIFRNGLPRAPHLGRPPWTLLVRKEAPKETDCKITPAVSSSHFVKIF